MVLSSGCGGLDDDSAASESLRLEGIELKLDMGKMTVLKAAELGDIAFIQEYLDEGGSVDMAHPYAGSMVYYAVRGRQPETLRFLLDRGANPKTEHFESRYTPLELAREIAETATDDREKTLANEMVAMLEQSLVGAEVAAEAVKACLAEGTEDSLRTALSLTRTHATSRDTKVSILRALLETNNVGLFSEALRIPGWGSIIGLDDYIRDEAYPVSESDRKALLLLRNEMHQRDFYLAFKAMIEYGWMGDKDKKGPYGHWNASGGGRVTMLMRAARAGNADFVRYLVEKGANVNAKDKERRTALDYLLSSDQRMSEANASAIREILGAEK